MLIHSNGSSAGAGLASGGGKGCESDGLDLVDAQDKQLVRDVLSVLKHTGLGKTYEIKTVSKGYEILSFFTEDMLLLAGDPSKSSGAGMSKALAVIAGAGAGKAAADAGGEAGDAGEGVMIFSDDLDLVRQVNRLRIQSVCVRFAKQRLCVRVVVLSHKEPVMLEEQTLLRVQKRRRWF